MADRFRICIIDIGSSDYGINIVILNDNIMKMKRTFITAFFAMLLVVFSVSCSSEEKEFDYAALPMSAQQFVKQYFADASYSRVEKEKDNGFWEVILDKKTFCQKIGRIGLHSVERVFRDNILKIGSCLLEF